MKDLTHCFANVSVCTDAVPRRTKRLAGRLHSNLQAVGSCVRDPLWAVAPQIWGCHASISIRAPQQPALAHGAYT